MRNIWEFLDNVTIVIFNLIVRALLVALLVLFVLMKLSPVISCSFLPWSRKILSEYKLLIELDWTILSCMQASKDEMLQEYFQ